MKGIAVLAAVVVSAALAIPGISSGQSSALPAFGITVGGGTVAITGTPQSGATTVNVTNSGKKPTGVTLVRLNDGVTEAQLTAALPGIAQDPNRIAPYGSIRYDATANPGASSVDTVLAAGTYVAFDSGGDNPASWPHTSFTVGKAATEAQLPAADKTISAIDFAFKGPKSIKRGSTVRFAQEGNVVHMIAAMKVQNAFVAKQVAKLLKAGKDRKVQKLVRGFAGFMDPASSGAVQQSRLSADAGTYVLVCFMPTQDGREHTQLGMVRTLKIKK